MRTDTIEYFQNIASGIQTADVADVAREALLAFNLMTMGTSNMRDLMLIKIRAYVAQEPLYFRHYLSKATTKAERREERGNPMSMLDGIEDLSDLELSELFERVIMLKYRQR